MHADAEEIKSNPFSFDVNIQIVKTPASPLDRCHMYTHFKGSRKPVIIMHKPRHYSPASLENCKLHGFALHWLSPGAECSQNQCSKNPFLCQCQHPTAQLLLLVPHFHVGIYRGNQPLKSYPSCYAHIVLNSVILGEEHN